MKIKMLSTAAGAAGAFQAGQTYEVDGDVAGPLIAAGAAERVDSAPKVEAAVVDEEVETATVSDEPEAAAPEPEWPLDMSPEEYLKRGHKKHRALARKIVKG